MVVLVDFRYTSVYYNLGHIGSEKTGLVVKRPVFLGSPMSLLVIHTCVLYSI